MIKMDDKKFKERVAKYLKLSHQTLAEMLALVDEDKCDVVAPNPINPEVIQPNNVHIIEQEKRFCPYTTTGRCTNPFHDCINCPGNYITSGNIDI